MMDLWCIATRQAQPGLGTFCNDLCERDEPMPRLPAMAYASIPSDSGAHVPVALSPLPGSESCTCRLVANTNGQWWYKGLLLNQIQQ